MRVYSFGRVFTHGASQGTLDFTNPFNRDIFAETIGDNFFQGSPSIANENVQRFKSTLDEAPEEKEVPESMAIMAGVSVCLSLVHDRIS